MPEKIFIDRDVLLEKAKGTDIYFQIKSLLTDIPAADVVPTDAVLEELCDICELRMKHSEEHLKREPSATWKGIYQGQIYAYRDLKEIIEQKYIGKANIKGGTK